MKLGFIGLGQMGSAMAANLLKAGHELAVWNRTPEKADALVHAGARRAASPRDAADATIVMTMLADDAAVEAVVYGETAFRAGPPSMSRTARSASRSPIVSPRITSTAAALSPHRSSGGPRLPRRASCSSSPPALPNISTSANRRSRRSGSAPFASARGRRQRTWSS